MAATRDPARFARLRQLADAEPEACRLDARIAGTRIAALLACKGGTISDITVGDCVELAATSPAQAVSPATGCLPSDGADLARRRKRRQLVRA